jgi:hypothetical protein
MAGYRLDPEAPGARQVSPCVDRQHPKLAGLGGMFGARDSFSEARPTHAEARGRLVSIEDAPGINASLVVQIADAAAVAYQAAGQGELTEWEDRGPGPR